MEIKRLRKTMTGDLTAPDADGLREPLVVLVLRSLISCRAGKAHQMQHLRFFLREQLLCVCLVRRRTGSSYMLLQGDAGASRRLKRQASWAALKTAQYKTVLLIFIIFLKLNIVLKYEHF